MTTTARVLGGAPSENKWLYHRIRFSVGDPAAYAELPNGRRLLLIRDIELERARKQARADACFAPGEFTPTSGLSGDRETATAQAFAEMLRREGVTSVVADRSFPLIFAHFLEQTGIGVACDPEMGVLERRAKDEQEVAWLREAQDVTEEAMRLACGMVADADARADGVLISDGAELTSERVRAAIDVFFLERGYATPHGSIIASGRAGSDCHYRGSGPIRTGEPVIIDIFPVNRATGYHGDCTRTVVHGEVPEQLAQMHAAVVEAKAAATAATRAGVTGDAVHRATSDVLIGRGYTMGPMPEDAPDSWCGMPHGTGHGIGLDVHEPPLLDTGGPELVIGDALTIEPGLYCPGIGGVRVEDMVIVTESGCENLNTLHEGLSWR